MASWLAALIAGLIVVGLGVIALVAGSAFSIKSTNREDIRKEVTKNLKGHWLGVLAAILISSYTSILIGLITISAPENTLIIFTDDGSATEKSKFVELAARQIGVNQLYVTKGKDEDYTNEFRIIYFNGGYSLSFATKLKENLSETDLADIELVPYFEGNEPENVAAGYVEFWFPR